MRARSATQLLVAVAAASLLVGCSDEPDPPEVLDGSSIDGDLTPIKDFEPSAWPVCDIESDTVLSGVDPDDFRAWTRIVDGHEEQVVVGIWRVEEAKAKRQFERFVDARQACADKGRAGRYVLDLSSAGNAPTYGFTARGLTSEPSYRLDHTYTWAPADGDTGDGYMAAVWLERVDGSEVSGDLDEIMDDQLKQIPGY